MAGAKVEAKVEEPLVRVSHMCLTKNNTVLSAEVVVPAREAIKLAKLLANEKNNEYRNPCTSVKCQSAKCKMWISILNRLKEKYSDLQDELADYEVSLDDEYILGELIRWALKYTKEHEMLDDYAEIVVKVLGDVDYEFIEDLLEYGYTPREIFNAFRKYIYEEDVLREFCYIRDDYIIIQRFLEEIGHSCWKRKVR